MKHLAFSVIIGFATSAWAQDKPAPAPEKLAAEPAKEAAKPVASKSAAPRKGTPSKRTEDARHCLEKASNTEVIKCAEEYL
jgi:hypothetical protein